jgi:hypothetical protein
MMTNIWVQLFSPFQDTLVDSIKDTVINKLLKKLIDLHSEELLKLLKIESKVNALINGPFKSGVEWLELASKPNRTEVKQTKYINLALEKFIDASSQQEGFDCAISQSHVALCFLLLGEYSDGIDWLKKAYDTCDTDTFTAFGKAQKKARTLQAIIFGGRRISYSFAELLKRNNAFLEGISLLIHDASELEYWRTERVYLHTSTGGAEHFDSPVDHYALDVYRGNTYMARLPDID